MLRTSFATAFSLLILSGTLACSVDVASEDVADRYDPVTSTTDPQVRGQLGVGASNAVTSSFSTEGETHGYQLSVHPGATVRLEIARKGTSRDLDTTLSVLGPQRADGSFPSQTIAFDDDSAWGKHSRIDSLTLVEGGNYLVVVGTKQGSSKGTYRLVAECTRGVCDPLPQPSPQTCEPSIARAISVCAESVATERETTDVTERISDLEMCSEPEVVAPAWDHLCSASQSHPWCKDGFETFATTDLPTCSRHLAQVILDGSCVFGTRYQDIFGPAGSALVVVRRRVIRNANELSSIEKKQLVLAVRSTAYSNVSTAKQALEFVDNHEANVIELWDTSNRLAFTTYEVGAGDNSFGAIFALGSTTQVASIVDGDLFGCTVFWGPERRTCNTADDCSPGMMCNGKGPDGTIGKCVDPSKDTHEDIGRTCSVAGGCDPGSGLVCAGISSGAEGLCLPAWMRGTFFHRSPVEIPDASREGVSIPVLASGLATVDTDVRLDLYVQHARPKDLRLFLTNPAGTEVEVHFTQPSVPELVLRNHTVLGFPGDESVNGLWTLRVVDKKRNVVGSVEEFSLTLTSRWD